MFFSRSLLGWIQSGFALLLGCYFLSGAFDLKRLWLIDGANLLFHEAGHIFFGLLGEWMGFWGGTLMQLLIPAGIGTAFLIQGKKYSASIMLLWFGENFFGISHYIKDARTQSLPLVGGEIHDWGYLLGEMRLLNHDQIIGNFVWVAGVCIVVTATVFALVFSEAKRQ